VWDVFRVDELAQGAGLSNEGFGLTDRQIGDEDRPCSVQIDSPWPPLDEPFAGALAQGIGWLNREDGHRHGASVFQGLKTAQRACSAPNQGNWQPADIDGERKHVLRAPAPSAINFTAR
jgi:hypothetical protein